MKKCGTVNKIIRIFVLILLINFFGIFLILPVDAQVGSVKNLNDNDVNKLKQQIVETSAVSNFIKPEISSPVSGGKVSGKNLQIRGIATSNSNVDILIESVDKKNSPLTGKTTSDRYGVWSYFLGPELYTGDYNIQVFTTSADNQVFYSEKVLFSVLSIDVSDTNSSGNIVGYSLKTEPLLIVVLSIIFMITFLGSMLIWAVVYFLKNSQKDKLNTYMKLWDNSKFNEVNNERWEQFLVNMNSIHSLFSKQKSVIDDKGEDDNLKIIVPPKNN